MTPDLQMYYSEKGPFKRGHGGQSITFENSAVVVHGTMQGSTYHPLLNISVIPQVRDETRCWRSTANDPLNRFDTNWLRWSGAGCTTGLVRLTSARPRRRALQRPRWPWWRPDWPLPGPRQAEDNPAPSPARAPLPPT